MFWRCLFSLSLIFHTTHSSVKQIDQWHCCYRYCWSFVLSSESVFHRHSWSFFNFCNPLYLDNLSALHSIMSLMFCFDDYSFHYNFCGSFSHSLSLMVLTELFFILVRIFCASKLLLYFLNSHYLVCPVFCFSLSMTHPQEILLLVCSFFFESFFQNHHLWHFPIILHN